jgi:hypothetical protein
MVIKHASSLHGVRYWAAWYANQRPAFEVFRYMGEGSDGLHYFQSRRSKAVVGMSTAQVMTPSFKPFLVRCKEENLVTAS